MDVQYVFSDLLDIGCTTEEFPGRLHKALQQTGG